MTREESLRIVKRIKSFYLSQSRGYTESDWLTMADTWYETFKHDDFEKVNRALSLYVHGGKQFMPNVADIINELTNMNEPETRSLFRKLCRECDKVVDGTEHITIIDLGGLKWDEELQRDVYHHPEARVTTTYTQADFAMMPKELQLYAEDIEGLRKLRTEIGSSYDYAYKRFSDRLKYIKEEIAEERARREKELLGIGG